MIFLFRSFARGAKKPQSIRVSNNFSFDEIIKDSDFLLSIGIKHFPISDKTNPNVKFDILSEDGSYIGNKSLKDAKKLISSKNPDLLLLDNDPPLLQLSNFKRAILKKIRVAQGKNHRKHFTEDFREIFIRNTIKSQDMALKMIKIEEFIKESTNLLIEIPFDNIILRDYDRAKVLANDTSLYLTQKFPEGRCEVIEKDDRMSIAFEPSSKREKMIEEICKNKELFKSAGMEFEYKKLKKTFKRYKNTYHPDAKELKEFETQIGDTPLDLEDD